MLQAWGDDYSDGEGGEGTGFVGEGALELSLCQTAVPDFYNQSKGVFLNETQLMPMADTQEHEQLGLADQTALAGDNLVAQPRRVRVQTVLCGNFLTEPLCGNDTGIRSSRYLSTMPGQPRRWMSRN